MPTYKSWITESLVFRGKSLNHLKKKWMKIKLIVLDSNTWNYLIISKLFSFKMILPISYSQQFVYKSYTFD